MHAIGAELTASIALRAATMAAHRRVEETLALPGSIRTAEDYRSWLVRFFAIYSPLEAHLARFSDWEQRGIDLHHMGHTAALRQDLIALGSDPDSFELAPSAMLPSLSSFAEALGALYVLEGSKLGGRYILADLGSRLPDITTRAQAFFAGNGARTGSCWTAFKDALDRCGLEHPEDLSGMIAGANATFEAIAFWMAPLAEEVQLQ
jgi:heme oxygenase